MEVFGRRPSALALAVTAAWLVSLSVANQTSSVNYFLEVVALAAPAAAVAWSRLARGNTVRPMLFALLALAQMILLFHLPNTRGVWPLPFPPHGYTPTAEDAAIGQEIDRRVAAVNGPVLAEPAGFAVRNGREVLVQPLDLRAEQLRGRWDSTELRARIRDQRFDLVILSHRLFPPDVLAELRRSYVVDQELTGPNRLHYTIYRPARTS
jgi:hypothetical protein